MTVAEHNQQPSIPLMGAIILSCGHCGRVLATLHEVLKIDVRCPCGTRKHWEPAKGERKHRVKE